jgi:hypothetical protein
MKTEPSIKKHPEEFLGMVSLGFAINKTFGQDDFECADKARNAVKAAFKLGWIKNCDNSVAIQELPAAIQNELRDLQKPTISLHDLIRYFEQMEIIGGEKVAVAYFYWKLFGSEFYHG